MSHSSSPSPSTNPVAAPPPLPPPQPSASASGATPASTTTATATAATAETAGAAVGKAPALERPASPASEEAARSHTDVDEPADERPLPPVPQQQPPSQRPASSSSSVVLPQLTSSPSPPSKPARGRSFFSRFALPFRTPARTVADFHIRPNEPHRKYTAGDHVLGAVILAVVKPVRITHLTVSLRGLVRVFKDASASSASLPADTVTESKRSKSSSLSTSSGSSYLGNGHALLFRDEMVLSGYGRLEPGNYEFQFDLIFPSQDLPSSIDFERGSITYVVTATLTRPTTVAPIQSCERKVHLVDHVDVGTVPKPRPRTISLEPISKRSKMRKIVVSSIANTPRPSTRSTTTTTTTTTSVVPTAANRPSGAVSTISFVSTGGGSISSDLHERMTLSDRGSARVSAHEPDSAAAAAEGDGSGRHESQTVPAPHPLFEPQQPQSPTVTDNACETVGGSVAGGSGGSGSGSGGIGAAGSAGMTENNARLASPEGSQTASSGADSTATTTATATNTSSSTRTTTAVVGNNAPSRPRPQHLQLQALSAGSLQTTTTVNRTIDDRTITATIELLKGGCLPGDMVSVRISVQHVKRIKSMHGVIVTLYRQGRIDSAPPESLFPSAGTSIVEEEGLEADLGTRNGINDDGHDRGSGDQARQIHEEQNGDAIQSANGDAHHDLQQQKKKKKQQEKEDKKRQKKQEKEDLKKSQRQQNGQSENYYPKSKTGLGGLSLMSAGTSSMFRKDLSQSFTPLIIDPRTLKSSVTASVRVPEDAFATIKGVPGDMISFKYQLEVIIDLGGKLASLLQSAGSGGSTGGGVINGINATDPYDNKPQLLSAPSSLWRGGGTTNMIDTDQLRRQKGVIYVAFEVVVGTTDSSRQRAGTLRLQQHQYQHQHQQYQQQQQQDPQEPQPAQPYVASYPPNWYPEDRKDPQHYNQQQQQQQQQPQQYPSWPVNGTGSAGPSALPDPTDDLYRRQSQQQQHRPSYDYPQQHDHHRDFNDVHYNYYNSANGSSGAPNPYPYNHQHDPNYPTPPSSLAPHYVPTPAMLAAARDQNLSEKERIRRAEERLLPSQPGQQGLPGQPGPSTSAADHNASAPTAPTAPDDDYDDYSYSGHEHAPPSAPTLDDLSVFLAGPSDGPSGAGPSAPPFAPSSSSASSSHHYSRHHHPPLARQLPPTEDKQELERRRLLAEASAPPDFPEDSYGGPSRHPGSGSRAGGGALAGPSAPVLEEEDRHGGDGAYAPHVPLSSDADAAAPPISDEDRYGRNYTYGPGTASSAAQGGSAFEPAEPLPRYER